VETSTARNHSPRNIVLIIEDDRWVADYISEVIEAFFGFKVLKTESPEAARQAFYAHHESIAAIISDLSLQGANGVSVVGDLARGKKEIGIVFVTGHVESERELSQRVGRPVTLVMKPFTPLDLKVALEHLLSVAAAETAV
jgi:DNA-binding NtrC family response regulator